MFFAVKYPIKIGGKNYLPCICYSLPDDLELTINKLVSAGKAYKFKEQVYFVNGSIVEKKAEVKKVTKKASKKEVVEDEGF